MKPVLGGFVTCRPKHIPLGYGEEQGLWLMSDLHIGAPNVNIRLIEKELRDARKRGDRILVNGDVFDAILHTDAKRFTPDSVHPRLHGRRDVVNEAIDWATEILTPYADLIDVIGIGNHETAIEKYHSMDMTKVLVYNLSRKLAKPGGKKCNKYWDHVVHYGGYQGWVDYRIGGVRYVICYHHGTGGGKGQGEFEKKILGLEGVDCFWLAHHHRLQSDGIERISCPMGGDGPLVRRVRFIRTGAYMKTYVSQSQKSLRKNGRRTNYAADRMLTPGLQGGCRITLRKRRCGLEARVEQ